MEGKPLADRIRAAVAEEVTSLGSIGLTTVLVGDDPASEIYIRLKQKAASEAGIRSSDLRLPATISEDELLDKVAELNGDDDVDALLVQLPLPDHIDEARVIRAVDPAKDVDGLHPLNAGELYLGRPALVPATPLGVMAILDEHRIELDGARAVVVGRSDIVGKPVAHLLLQANATVTICHSHTGDLARQTLEADVLVVAAGRPALVSTRHGQDGERDRRRRHPSNRRRPGRRRRSGGRRDRRFHDARARRRRADDDRVPAPEHRPLRPLSARRNRSPVPLKRW